MPEPIEKSVGSYNTIYIDRVDISKIENGNANPSLKNIKRVAEGLGKKVELRFV